MGKTETFRISWHPIGGPGINVSLKKRFEENVKKKSLLGKYCPVLSRKNHSALSHRTQHLTESPEI